MGQISRLKANEISPGNTIAAADLEAEIDQLVNNDNAQDTRITSLESGTMTISGNKTLSGDNTHSGVNIFSGTLKVPVSAGYTPTANGHVGYDSTSHTYDVYVNGAAKSLLHTGSNLDDLGDVTITSAASGQILKYNGSAWVNSYNSYALLQDQKTNGTNGGTFTSGAWRTRDLNTEVIDGDGIISLSANQFTLAAGTYRIRAKAPAYNTNDHRLRLRNTTDGTTTLEGPNAFSDGSNNGFMYAEVEGQFTIAGSKAFEIQHQCGFTRATDGFGRAASLGTNEVYTQVELWRIA